MMNNDEFLKKLSEVAEWEIPDSVTGTLHKPKVLESEEPTEPVEFEEVIEDQNFPPWILKLKRARDCEDCGKHLPDGRTVETRCVFIPMPHWRRRCTHCGLHEDPHTKQITLPWAVAAQLWTQHIREKKRMRPYYPRPNAVKRVMPYEPKILDVEESDDAIIRRYERSPEADPKK